MTLDEVKDLCLSFPQTTYDFPFDEQTLVFRVGKKMFALCDIEKKPLKVNLKCDPALSRDLRASYPEIVPGWHMNKEHWNTVNLEGNLEKERVIWLFEHSYNLVAAKKNVPRGTF